MSPNNIAFLFDPKNNWIRKFIIPTILKQVPYDSTIVVKDGSPRRDFIYLDSLVDSLFKTMDCDKGYRVYNIGSGESQNVQEVVESAQSAAHTKKEVISKAVTMLK